MTMAPGLSIIVPTYNRPKELNRLMQFLESVGNDFPILILDGSSDENKLDNKRIVKRFPSASYHSFPPDLHLGLRLREGLSLVNTACVVICPDDDFVFPDCLSHCTRFLQEHSDYSAVTGRVSALAYTSRVPVLSRGFRIIDALPNAYDLGHESFLRRMLHLIGLTFAGCPPLFYAVKRTGQTREAFALLRDGMKYSSMELLINAATLLQGKAGVLPTLFGLRDYSSETTRDAIRDDPVAYFSHDDLQYIRSLLIPLLVDRESLSPETAGYAVHILLDQYYPVKSPAELFRPHETPGSLEKCFWAIHMLESILLPGFLATRLGIDREVVVKLRRSLNSQPPI